MPSKKEEKFLVRMPQSLGFDPNALMRTFGKEANIVRDLLFMASSEKCNKNLFGDILLTVEDFTNLGHKRTELQRVLPQFKKIPKKELNAIIQERKDLVSKSEFFLETENPVYVVDKDTRIEVPFLNDHPCITQLDYALYQAVSVVFKVTRKVNDNIETLPLKLLDFLRIKNVSKVEKRGYELRLAGGWINNMFNEYNLIDYDDYASIKEGKMDVVGSYRNLLIFLGRIISAVQYQKEQGNVQEYITPVDEILRVLNRNISSPRNKKIEVKTALDNFKKQLQHVNFDWCFDNNNGKARYKYFVKFTVDEITLAYFDEKMKAVVMNLFEKQAKAVWMASKRQGGGLGEQLIRNRGNSLYDVNEFYNWLANDDDIELKESMYKDAESQVYKTPINNAKELKGITSKPAKTELKKTYVQIETLIATAAAQNITVEELAKKIKYKKDAGGYYKLH